MYDINIECDKNSISGSREVVGLGFVSHDRMRMWRGVSGGDDQVPGTGSAGQTACAKFPSRDRDVDDDWS